MKSMYEDVERIMACTSEFYKSLKGHPVPEGTTVYLGHQEYMSYLRVIRPPQDHEYVYDLPVMRVDKDTHLRVA